MSECVCVKEFNDDDDNDDTRWTIHDYIAPSGLMPNEPKSKSISISHQ